jgi:hypothetical protein
LNNDLNEVWGLSQKSISDIPRKAFEYNPSAVKERSNSKMAVFLSKNKNPETNQINFTRNDQSDSEQLFAKQVSIRNQKQRQLSMETAGFNPDQRSQVTTTNRSNQSAI